MGFTLIELLIVIAIIGLLAAGILVLLDPVDKINSANDAKVQSDISGLGRTSENYATQNNAFYPQTAATLVTSGEIRTVPAAPGGYSAYAYGPVPSGCTTACTSLVITGQLKSKKFTATPFWRYESTTGKNCAVASAATACP